ncbi:LysE/ArgO family amino acid transporter [Ligilactobacillus ruminis]|uniref:Lysine permease n=3 Tax=Ligilactobacillus ruminis TaxID=1623 RepID=G2SM30_LIGR2|nr:LysE family transporter [Ligilactobacillus ruminis]MCR5748732.1 LysE family transporter [Lactobacillus sp.]AEN79017.1 Lysine permease [Ligilactobacillus ruminis ATCC 27782]KLA45812.1 Lysine permease [Ligilactobacillus ruminis]KRM83126.1 Lysine permease [Ligilactobacillus ruminis DSM 20403 = NBRC 102161]MCF2544997.1 LysE family transporter [Ligilactobacillus ruminis]
MIYLRGILIGFAFVTPIGMQNIYMFNNALSNKMSKALLYNFLVWFCDALFSFAAFYGIGALISANEIVKIIVMLVGGALTSYIGFNIIRSAKQTAIGSDSKKQTLKQALMTALIVSWGNPQAMIDGTMMLGASRATLTFEQSILFITGVITASFIWDHGITIGFNLLRDKLPKKFLLAINLISGIIVAVYGLYLILTGITEIHQNV